MTLCCKTADKRIGIRSGHHRIQGREDVPSNISPAQMLWIVRFLCFVMEKCTSNVFWMIWVIFFGWWKESFVICNTCHIYFTTGVTFLGKDNIRALVSTRHQWGPAQVAMPKRMACDVFALAALLRRWLWPFWSLVEFVDTCITRGWSVRSINIWYRYIHQARY